VNAPVKDISPVAARPSAIRDLTTQAGFLEKAGLQLKEWGYQIDGLVADAAKLEGAERKSADATVAELQERVAAARRTLTASRSVVNDKWSEARRRIEAVWVEITAAFAKHGIHRPGEDDITEKYPV